MADTIDLITLTTVETTVLIELNTLCAVEPTALQLIELMAGCKNEVKLLTTVLIYVLTLVKPVSAP